MGLSLAVISLLACLVGAASAGDVFISASNLFSVHRFTMRHLADELIRRGHTVTWLEYGLTQSDIPLPSGVREIFIPVKTSNQAVLNTYLHRNSSLHRDVWFDAEWDRGHQSNAWLASIELCDALLADPSSRAVFDDLVGTKFDAVVIDDLYNPCGLLHVALQRSVFVYWSLTGLRTESAWANQSPSPPSYIPVAGTGLTDRLSFWQRGFNFFAYLKELYIHHHIVLKRIDALATRHLPALETTAFDVERNASINFVNHPPIFDFARPYMPRVNFVGGLHCKNATALQGRLHAFVEGAQDDQGFVVLSTGFSLQWRYAPDSVKDNLLAAFRSLPKLRFIWQYNGLPIKDLPTNVFLAEWLPLQDLLGHKKCRAHISHGGQNSVIESMWHGVPVIGWPLTIWGYDNLLRVTDRHAGILVGSKNPSKNEWVGALHRVNIKYHAEEVALFRDMLIDVPYTELNHSAFWVEFIIRHQEVPHARSGADKLNIVQYFLVDVTAFLAAVALIGAAVAFYLIRFTVTSVFVLVTLPVRFALKSRGQNARRTPATKKSN